MSSSSTIYVHEMVRELVGRLTLDEHYWLLKLLAHDLEVRRDAAKHNPVKGVANE